MFYNSTIFEDLYTTYLYLDNCNNFYYLDKVLYTVFHESKTESLSSNIDYNKFEKALEILVKTYNSIGTYSLHISLEYRLVSAFASYLKNKKYKKNVKKSVILKVAQLLDDRKNYYYIPNTHRYSIIDLLKKLYIFLSIKIIVHNKNNL